MIFCNDRSEPARTFAFLIGGSWDHLRINLNMYLVVVEPGRYAACLLPAVCLVWSVSLPAAALANEGSRNSEQKQRPLSMPLPLRLLSSCTALLPLAPRALPLSFGSPSVFRSPDQS